MGLMYSAVIAAVLGRQRRCPACGKLQVIDHVEKDGHYHCKKCGQPFTRNDLKPPSRGSR